MPIYVFYVASPKRSLAVCLILKKLFRHVFLSILLGTGIERNGLYKETQRIRQNDVLLNDS